MKSIKSKFLLITSLAIFISVLSVSITGIYMIRRSSKKDIQGYYEREMERSKLNLKHLVDVVYDGLDSRFKEIGNEAYILKHYGNISDSLAVVAELQKLLRKEYLDLVSKIRYDNGEGYFWITDNQLPYPTMIMHAAKPQNNGRVMSDQKYNVVKGKEGKNLYQERVEICKANGDAFVEYIMNKPGTDIVENKLSYSRLYRPLGWVISTGIYTDSLQDNMREIEEQVSEQLNQVMWVILVLALVITALGIVVSYHFSEKITRILFMIRDRAKDLAKGRTVELISINRNDELGEITNSMNDLVNSLNDYIVFSKEIGSGNLDYTLKNCADDAENVLGMELTKMRDNLKKADEEEKRRNWSMRGMASFVEILRSQTQNTEELSNTVLTNLIKYINANQGSLFILSEGESKGEEYLEMAACYAYNKKKYVHKRIYPGEGLLGQVILEKETINLTEIPQNYVNITSGLGDAPPTNLLLVPLKVNNKVEGAIEIASFRKFAQYEIEFIERLAENIASTISSVKVNERTKQLLEASQQHTEEMRAQEEELRQNMEELVATQEEMSRRQTEAIELKQTLEVETQELKQVIDQKNQEIQQLKIEVDALKG
ncbi:cache domain-containing protein [Rapidithrix thailandica]|uniref:histidine kinase n=1 Tax=Rapidithrix thailandica TaxID=413964 RepID=A0AAW9RSZ3_9BACT